MALILKDRVRETSTMTGTGAITLNGAVTGYQAFSSVGNSNTVYYCMAGQATNEWEVGIGTYVLATNTLTRNTVLSSSNGGSTVTFTVGTKDVFLTYPAAKSANVNAALTADRVTYATTDGLLTDSANLTFDGTSLGLGGNLAFTGTGTGNRITGDFSNATIANRVAFQTSTVNGNTSVHTIPNGTSASSGFKAESDPAMANGSFAAIDVVGGGYVGFSSNIRGTGTYLPMTFYTSGSERVRVDTSGNVGIGTSSPGTYKLSVAGNALIADSDYGFGNIELGKSGTGDRAAYIDFHSSGTPNALDNSARVIRNAGVNGNLDIINTGAGDIVASTSNLERMRIDATGNVGIGLVPSLTGGQLQVSGAGNNASARFSGNANGMAVLNQNGLTVYTNLSAGSTDTTLVAGNTASTYMAFGVHNGTAYNERMRIDASGNVGIGTSLPSASAILDVQSTTKGVRMPNMTTTQKNAISSPAAGLMVFDTTLAKLCVYTGAAWQTITSA